MRLITVLNSVGRITRVEEVGRVASRLEEAYRVTLDVRELLSSSVGQYPHVLVLLRRIFVPDGFLMVYLSEEQERKLSSEHARRIISEHFRNVAHEPELYMLGEIEVSEEGCIIACPPRLWSLSSTALSLACVTVTYLCLDFAGELTDSALLIGGDATRALPAPLTGTPVLVVNVNAPKALELATAVAGLDIVRRPTPVEVNDIVMTMSWLDELTVVKMFEQSPRDVLREVADKARELPPHVDIKFQIFREVPSMPVRTTLDDVREEEYYPTFAHIYWILRMIVEAIEHAVSVP